MATTTKENIFIDILNSDIKMNENSIENSMKIGENEFEFFHIQEITYEDDAPRREALENVLGALRVKGVNFAYLIIGSKDGISFYLGVVKNQKTLEIDIDDIAKQILKSNIEGNFRGSKVVRLTRSKKKELREKIKSFSNIAEVNGVPDVNEEAEKFQGVDRLVDIMLRDEFALMIISSALSLEDIEKMEKELFKIYDKISPYVKKTIQKTTSKSKSDNETTSKTTSATDSTSTAESTSKTNSETDNTTKTNGGKSQVSSDSASKSESTSKTKTNSETDSKTSSISYANNRVENEILNVEFAKKELEEWLKYIDEVLLKRIYYAKGKGAFISGVYLFADTKGKITKLGNSFISLFSGVNENKLPLQYEIITNKKHKEAIYNFQLPKYKLNLSTNQAQKMILFSKINGLEWFSTKELSIIASLPQKEVVGLKLKEEVEFGLNVPKKEGIHLGKLVRSGQELDIDVNLKVEDLNKHIFVAGVTGSGKTTTCQTLLYSSKLPFLVIEPAKTEYRVLTECDDILVFTLGNENVAPFRLNPFEFFEGENISSRVDMIRAAIESSFDMEAAIPQIIESAIYKAYEDYGWDIGLSKNMEFDNPFEEGINSFPLLEDVLNKVEEVVKEQNFDERLHKDYIGSIKARLQSFLVGSKKYMLNTPRSYDFRELLHKKVILELEEIKSPSEKSFIMGLILINLNEALKWNYKKDKKFRHITLIEEAHRLLSRYEPGDSLNKKSGVESFADMLAEVRKYGESLIIVDQIPNKLTSEVLKNTNTKIVHRIFAQDDKEAIGNTMTLEKEQKDFLNKLDVGRAIVFNQNFYNSIQVQIKQLENISTTSEKEIDEKRLREIWLNFYGKIHKLNENLTIQDIDVLSKLEMLWDGFMKEAEKRDSKTFDNYYSQIQSLLLKFNETEEIILFFIIKRFYSIDRVKDIRKVFNAIENGEKLGLLIKKIRR